MDRIERHRETVDEQDFPTTQQILNETENARRLIERMSINNGYIADNQEDDKFYNFHIGRIFISDQETLFEKEEENEGPPASP